MIIARKGQFLALENVNQCPRQLEPSVARKPLPETCEKGLRRVCTQIVCALGKASQINSVDAEEDTGSVTKETELRKQMLFLKHNRSSMK